MEVRVRNVNAALARMVRLLDMEQSEGAANLVAPRGMNTLEFNEPVTTIYDRPTERVLFSHVRDANPFLHFFEALWMIQGRQDVAFLKHFASRMVEFSDDGERFNGAYGWRWRNEFGFDQLTAIINLLKQEPTSRRAVLTMWQPGDLRYKVGTSKDVPCNTQIYFKVRNGALNMTLCNRSNDMIWGAYGANAVHFSMLQEYMADKLGLEVGLLIQHSDSLHVYLPPHPGGKVWERLLNAYGQDERNLYVGTISPVVRPLAMNANSPGWDDDLREFFKMADARIHNPDLAFNGPVWKTEYFANVVEPMWMAYEMRDPNLLHDCPARDWKTAGQEWLVRRDK